MFSSSFLLAVRWKILPPRGSSSIDENSSWQKLSPCLLNMPIKLPLPQTPPPGLWKNTLHALVKIFEKFSSYCTHKVCYHSFLELTKKKKKNRLTKNNRYSPTRVIVGSSDKSVQTESQFIVLYIANYAISLIIYYSYVPEIYYVHISDV